MPRTAAANQPPHHRARAYQRVVRLGWLEWTGIPALALLPLLALAGWLGPASQRLEATVPHGAGALKLEVSYPSRTRHKAGSELAIQVTNSGPDEARDLAIGIEDAYLAHFSRADALPTADAVAAGRVRVPLPRLRAGDSTAVRVRLEADGWGSLPGWIELGPRERPALTRQHFSTLVLP